MKRIAFLAALVLLLGGCTSVEISHKGRNMVEIRNTGWSLFHFIPIASGDPEYPNALMCTFLRNTVTLENNMKMLGVAMKDENALSVRDLISYTTDENVFLILLRRRTYHTSAQMIYPENPETECEK